MMTLMLAAAAQGAAVPAASGAPELLNEGNVFAAGDYPREALAREEQGVVSVVLAVSAAGKVTGCEVTESSGHARLDFASCTIARKRAQFAPARDAAGQPVAGQYRMATAWWLPGLDLQTAQLEVPMQVSRLPQGYRQPVKARLLFDMGGHVTDCTVTTSSGSPGADNAVCAYSRQTVTIAPLRPGAGPAATVAVRYLTAALSGPAATAGGT